MARGSGNPPDPAELWRKVSATDKRRIAYWNKSPDLARQGLPPRGGPVVDPHSYAQAAEHTGIPSPMEAIPTASSKGQFSSPVYEVIPVFGDDLNDSGAESMSYYSFNEAGFGYQNNAQIAQPNDDPAPITIVPTSTINPDRPRTVAAGYDFAQRKLTVVFRDGTYYNYFDVPNTLWQNFKRARSKGRFILAYLDQRPRGVADVSSIPSFARETVYRFMRTGQITRQGYQDGQKVGSKRGSGYGSGNLGGTGRKRLKKSLGQNGPTGGNST